MENALNKIIEKRKILNIYSIIVILILITHCVSFYFFKLSDFDDIFDAFESSPIFDFNIGDNCGVKSQVIFGVWEGKEPIKGKDPLKSKKDNVDRTNIKKLNGKLFCYKHISYKKLLYNGQIRKKTEQYNGNYTYDCGIVDTLNQHLYIKNGEKCPLYDVRIGTPDILDYYNYSGYPYELYYNNDNYNNSNKKIIGKLILNDGQPCYKLNEKLWRKFDSKEAEEEHLKCELNIFGKFNDDKFMHKGDITYDQLYKDNLSDENYDLLKDKLNDLKVSLYSREFLGIDKSCDEKADISKDKYENLKKNQEMERKYLFLETISLFIVFITSFVIGLAIRFDTKYDLSDFYSCIFIFILICFFIFFLSIFFHSVFLGRIIYNNISYNCSDDKTNEVIKKENEKTKKTILYAAVNLGLEIFIVLLDILLITIYYLFEKFEERKISWINSIYKKNDSYKSNKINNDPEMEPIAGNNSSSI